MTDHEPGNDRPAGEGGASAGDGDPTAGAATFDIYRGDDGHYYSLPGDEHFDPEGDVALTGLQGQRRARAAVIEPFRMSEEDARELAGEKLEAMADKLLGATERLNRFADEIREQSAAAKAAGPDAPSAGEQGRDLVETLERAFQSAAPGVGKALEPLAGVVDAIAGMTDRLEGMSRAASDPAQMEALEAQIAQIVAFTKDAPAPDAGEEGAAAQAELEQKLAGLWRDLEGAAAAAGPASAKPHPYRGKKGRAAARNRKKGKP